MKVILKLGNLNSDVIDVQESPIGQVRCSYYRTNTSILKGNLDLATPKSSNLFITFEDSGIWEKDIPIFIATEFEIR